jgi:chemotaxis protein MotB
VSDKNERPIIIVKRPKKGGGGHHGGAWKVAYADFVTAMMAFFMVMWLVAAVSKEQRAAMFEYFKNPSMEEGKSVKPAKGANGPGGASTAVINLGGGLDAVKSAVRPETGLNASTAPAQIELEQAKKMAAEAEKKQLAQLMEQLREAIDTSVTLKQFKDQLLLDITPDGLRIQIVDNQNRAMFDLGSSRLKGYTATILHELATYLNTVPNRLSLTGHTDTTPYPGKNGYSNWDLSADRANAARRALEDGGLKPEKTARVVGLSSAVLFDQENSRNPINRRISIIVMTRQAEERALNTDRPHPVDEQGKEATAPAGDAVAPAAPGGAPTGMAAAPGEPAAAAAAPPTVALPTPAAAAPQAATQPPPATPNPAGGPKVTLPPLPFAKPGAH